VTLVVSRRAVVVAVAGTAALGTGGAVAAGRFDDAIRALGIRPHPEPSSVDIDLVKTAGRDAADLLNQAESAGAADTIIDLLREQLASLGGTRSAARDRGDADFATACRAVADRRAAQSLKAVSPDLAVVLASSAAGLDQAVAVFKASR